MTGRDDEPRLVIPPKLRRQLRVADTGIAVCIAAAGAALVWAMMHPGQVMPLPTPEMPPEPYWVPVPPVRDPWAFGAAIAAAFGTVLACYLDPAHPLARWAARKFNRPEMAGEYGWFHGTVAPAVRQSCLRAAVLVAGIVGIALWHFGWDGIGVLRSSVVLTSGLTLGIATAGLISSFDLRRGLRFASSMVPALLAYQAGVAAAGWALAAVSGVP